MNQAKYGSPRSVIMRYISGSMLWSCAAPCSQYLEKLSSHAIGRNTQLQVSITPCCVSWLGNICHELCFTCLYLCLDTLKPSELLIFVCKRLISSRIWHPC